MDIFLASFLGILLFTFIVVYYVIKIWNRRYSEFIERIGPENIIVSSRKVYLDYRYLEDRNKRSAISGSCHFAVTDEEIFYEALFPKRPWRIPYSNIREIYIEEGFNMNGIKHRHLVIEYIDEKDRKEIIAAFYMKEPEKWLKIIQKQIEK